MALRLCSRGATISSARHNKRNRKNVISVLLLLRFSYLQIKRSPDDDKPPFKHPPWYAITTEIHIYVGVYMYVCMCVLLSVWYIFVYLPLQVILINAVGAINRNIYVCMSTTASPAAQPKIINTHTYIHTYKYKYKYFQQNCRPPLFS